MILNECMTETCRSQTKSVLQVGSTMCICTRVSSCFESVQYSKLQLNVLRAIRWCTVHRVADIRSQLNILKLQLNILRATRWCTVHRIAVIRSQLNILSFDQCRVEKGLHRDVSIGTYPFPLWDGGWGDQNGTCSPGNHQKIVNVTIDSLIARVGRP